ncbi:ricin-type beta-trefoil lectin domain protein [Streptomyces sp. NPDC006309]|uniref:ricin-type beta-trefoil lectin domain protein n=1 Tax=Streptomyces sp. NPDC006309 TaxID=3156749 RepID=UPI0033AFB72C
MHEAGPSDEQLGAALRKWTGTSPALHPVGELLDRHWTAAFAYARLCTDGPRAAGMLTTAAFTRLFGASLRQAGPTAAWRPHVLVAVRRIAAEWDTDERRELLHPALRPDDGTGERVAARLLPPSGRRLLSRAFQRVPETSRAVLWHTEVEAEPLSVPAALLGLDEESAGVELRRARERLRDECLQAHRELAPEDECRRYLRMLDVTFRRGGTDIDPDLRQHLARCPHCTRTADQLDRFNTGLGAALAEAVLGWGAHGYLESRTTRTATPPPAATVAAAQEAAFPYGAAVPPGGESFTAGQPAGPAGPAASTAPAAPDGSGDPATSGTAGGPGRAAGRGGAAGRRIPGALRRAAAFRASATPAEAAGTGGRTAPADPAAPPGRRAPGTRGRGAGFRASGAPGGTADAAGPGESGDPAGLAAPTGRSAPGPRRRAAGSRTSARPVTADTGRRGDTTAPAGHAAAARATDRTGPQNPEGPAAPVASRSPRSLHRAVRRARRRQVGVLVLAVGGMVAIPLVLWAVHGSGGAPGPGAAGTPSRTPGGNTPSPGASWAGGSGAGQGALHGRLHNLASGLCVGVVGKKAVQGAETELTACSAAPAQQWTYETDGLLRNAAAPDLCLDSRLGYSVRLAPCAAKGAAARTIRYDFTLQGVLVPRSNQELALTPAATDGSGALVLKTRTAAGAGRRWTVDTAEPDLRMKNVDWDGDTVPVPPAVPAPTS